MQASNQHLNVKHAVINESTAADNEIVAAVPGKRIKVVALYLLPNGTTTLTFKSGTTAITGPLDGTDAVPIAPSSCMGGLFQTEKGEALNLTSSAAVQHSGFLSYIESPV